MREMVRGAMQAYKPGPEPGCVSDSGGGGPRGTGRGPRRLGLPSSKVRARPHAVERLVVTRSGAGPASSRQVLREESSGGYDFDPLVAGSTEQRSIAGDDAMGAGPERAREELDVLPVLTGIVRQSHG